LSDDAITSRGMRPNDLRISCEGAARQPPRRPRCSIWSAAAATASAPSSAACAG